MQLTNENYFADRHYWSGSCVKTLLECPARAIAERAGDYHRPPSPAMLLGSYIDAFFDGAESHDAFITGHPEAVNSRTGELKKDFAQARAMIERAQSDYVFMSYLDGERQKILTGTIGGIPFKGKLDFYIPGERIVDLKTVKDFEPMYKPGEGRVTFAEYWNWPLQLAIYQQLEGNRLPCYLACISKQDPPDLMILEIPQHTLDAEIEILKAKLPLLDAMASGIVESERCERCAYCRETKKITGAISLDDLIEFK